MNVKVRKHSRNICPLRQTKLAAVSRVEIKTGIENVSFKAAEKVVFDRKTDTLMRK